MPKTIYTTEVVVCNQCGGELHIHRDQTVTPTEGLGKDIAEITLHAIYQCHNPKCCYRRWINDTKIVYLKSSLE